VLVTTLNYLDTCRAASEGNHGSCLGSVPAAGVTEGVINVLLPVRADACEALWCLRCF
jgi:hypothetical protein